MSAARPNLYRRLTSSVPLLVTVLVHVVLGLAGYFVVTEQIIGKKKTFEAAAATQSIAQKQVEHRLQVARKGGGSASSSPVSAARIFSTAENALQMPAMPDLPSVGASSLSGMGFGSGLGGVGSGTGYNTGLGSSSLGGAGFMSMSFLGVTNQRSSKVAFVVDISPGLMDIRKGGFRAFEILRTEISRLVATLNPANEFNVVLYDGTSIRLFSNKLTPATVANKQSFISWLAPINASLDALGSRSIPAISPHWSFKPTEALKLDPGFNPADWVHAIHAALELQPDTVFVITGNASAGRKRLSDESIARRLAAREKALAEAKANKTEAKPDDTDYAAIGAARNRALTKIRADLDEINRKLVSKGKDPFVVPDIRRVFAADFQAALKKAGYSLKLDGTGWTDKAGNLIWTSPDTNNRITTSEGAEFTDVIDHISKLQYGLLPKRATLNLFLFTGPAEDTERIQKNLSTLATKNGGKFTLLTTKRLEEIAGQEK
jgi:hypothetical protein